MKPNAKSRNLNGLAIILFPMCPRMFSYVHMRMRSYFDILVSLLRFCANVAPVTRKLKLPANLNLKNLNLSLKKS